MPDLFSTDEAPMSQDIRAHYVRTQEYTSTPKYPPGSAIGSALGYFGHENYEDDNDTVVVDNKILNSATHQFSEGDFVCPGFFSLTNLDGFTRRFKCNQWSYEMRRQAQPIFPFLSLGPSSCLRDREFLRSQGFTLLLAIRSSQSAQAPDFRFPHAIRRINDHLAGVDVDTSGEMEAFQTGQAPMKRKVLVFCESGNERSAAVVIAYMMAMLNMDPGQALHLTQQHRFCVSIEDPLKRILFSFESILSAKRDVERVRRSNMQTGATTLAPPPVPPVLLSKKRSFADHYHEDTDMADGDMEVDGDRDFFSERRPVAPFQDRVV
ncbi:Protein-tyrosine/Dual-specificity phosphatase [Penicillium maclennaniae]|uniref:Protein-tyrosine/Dual-specificity phosphatase n=1 Tax=Penicillium maclennaniae TaxID=1343394 RepID=UPI0025410860|nr:Protein-tyrosine/Dual-specificity phosphatase [Penicillium maclennaniae]KAJ5676966.1 Protein-tyrosine/Dual-specificity phosphatase [Penicillium maclennaniae]